LIESQLFGHKKGAFTGATSDQPGLFRAAEGGSLFLDEIGEMPLALQPKLLRAIQEKEIRSVGGTETEQVDVRIIAATHQDLVQRAKDKSFRQDLYARLALWQLEVPPVRERRRDVLSWVHRLYGAWREDRGMDEDRLDFDLEAAETLLLSKWSENLRGIDRFVHEIAARRPRGRLGINAIPSWVTA
ncbi:MAG: sigma 54-interacting transcriptional regulator, partial [Deltaproteobacteria bacterium]